MKLTLKFFLLCIVVTALLLFVYFNIKKESPQVETRINPEPEFISWSYSGTSWKPEKTPSECEEFSEFRVFDTNNLTSLTLPGYFQQEEYVTYSQISFDTNKVNVYLPIDAYLIQAGSYLDGAGDIQYRLTFLNPCGLVLQYDHLSYVSNELSNVMKQLPNPLFQSKALHDVNPMLVKSGSKIASKIGVYSQSDYYFNFGMYDLRDINALSKNDIEWFNKTYSTAIYSHYGVCWLEYYSDIMASEINVKASSSIESDFCNNF